MCGFTFTVFLSLFQLLPTAPYHILDLGGSTFASGLFLGFLTYSSALSAPLTGAIADRIGKRRVLITSSIAITVFSIAYGLITDYRLLLALVPIHGVFWSGLLSASAAYMTSILPEHRRAEGIGYWGISTVAALAVAPSIGFWIYRHGWLWLCVVSVALNITMGVIAWCLHEDTPHDHAAEPHEGGLLEWRVLLMSVTLFLYSFGYGGITSFTALYADFNGVRPQAIYLTTLAIVILMIRPFAGRLGDRLGYKRVFIPCLVLISAGLTCLAVGGTRPLMVAVGRALRPRLRHGVPGLRRLHDEGRPRRAPRGGVRRDSRGVRHRRRHRLDDDGLDHPALRLPRVVGSRGRPVGAGAAVLPRHGSAAEAARRSATDGHGPHSKHG